MSNVEEVVKTELQKYEDQESKVQALAAELQQNPKFAEFIQAQQAFAEMQATVWGSIEQAMIENNIKSIKTDKVTLTIAERTNFDIDMDLLPKKYTKVVPNTTLIGSEFKLTGVPVKGTTPTKKKYLTKRFAKGE
jgi:hypothetical protein